MRMVLFGTAALYGVGVVATALGQAAVLYLDGWGAVSLTWRALEMGLSWPLALAALLAEVRF